MDSRLRGNDSVELQAPHPAYDPGSSLRFVRDDNHFSVWLHSRNAPSTSADNSASATRISARTFTKAGRALSLAYQEANASCPFSDGPPRRRVQNTAMK